MTYQPAPAEVPIWAPYYGAPLSVAFKRGFTKYATFSGRASLSEYWWWVLIHGVIGIVLYILVIVFGVSGATYSDGQSVPSPLIIIPAILLFVWILGTVVPTLALLWRRLHDANLSGAFYFLALIPFGGIVVLVFTLMGSKPEGARFDVPPFTLPPARPYPPTV